MFRLSGMLMHPKGHTHNILDQLYGVIARAFQYVDHLEDIEAVAEALRDILRRPNIQAWLGADVEVYVEVLTSVRRWDRWLDQTRV